MCWARVVRVRSLPLLEELPDNCWQQPRHEESPATLCLPRGQLSGHHDQCRDQITEWTEWTQWRSGCTDASVCQIMESSPGHRHHHCGDWNLQKGKVLGLEAFRHFYQFCSVISCDNLKQLVTVMFFVWSCFSAEVEEGPTAWAITRSSYQVWDAVFFHNEDLPLCWGKRPWFSKVSTPRLHPTARQQRNLAWENRRTNGL